MRPCLRVGLPAELLVFKERRLQLQGSGTVIDERVYLEVLLVAAHVHVGRADGGHAVVGDYSLRVHVAAPPEIHLDTRVQHLPDIGAGGKGHRDALVAAVGYHHPHVHAGEGRVAERHQHGVGGNQVGRLYVDVLAAARNHPHYALHDHAPFVHRAGGGYLHRHAAAGRYFRVVRAREQQFLRGELPVRQEAGLKFGDGRPAHAHVGVAPFPAAYAGRVAFSDVHAAEVADPAVDHHHLAVVAVVRVARQEGNLDLDEGLHLDPSGFHAAEETLAGKIRRVVVLQPDLQALPRLAHQHVLDLAAYGVVLNLEELEMDVAAGGLQVGEQVGEHGVEIGVDAYVIARHRVGAVGSPEQLHHILVVGRQLPADAGRILLLGHLLEAAQVIVGDEALAAIVPAEEEIQHQPHAGKAHEHHYPRQGTHGMPVLGDDHGHDAEDGEQEDDVEPHLPELFFGRIYPGVVAGVGDDGGEIYRQEEQQHEQAHKVEGVQRDVTAEKRKAEREFAQRAYQDEQGVRDDAQDAELGGAQLGVGETELFLEMGVDAHVDGEQQVDHQDCE